MSQRRVVITGMGAITPLGNTVDRFWEGLIEGRSGIGPITRFDVSAFDVRFGGECGHFDPDRLIDRRAVKRLDRFSQFALAAARDALAESGLTITDQTAGRVGVIVGSGIGGLEELESQHSRLENKGPGKVSAFTIPKLMVNAAAGNISMEVGAKGISAAVATACASATNAMGDALNAIRRGAADVVLTGGSEAALTPLGLAAFAAMKALSTRNEDPPRACRPFDRDRDGFVLAEGAGILVFEELECARSRGAIILAEVAGCGVTSDAGHITQPLEDGAGGAAAMRLALMDARLNPDDVDYINAHGTSTPLGDVAETIAIKTVFGSHARRLAVSSTKSSVGHSLGASGGIELIATVRALYQGVAPPTINLDQPGEGCDLDYVPNVARDMPIRAAMSNSFGFGGHNASIVIKRFEG
ncbi:MAG: beta-ketoacyl-[acyl-carrier-protein] synthase II [Phycisphaerales bacterium]|nr:MAG: beta-ketoacyl-[acyl-carrier-protein] synthase II [Phycisphaerales bacterium]